LGIETTLSTIKKAPQMWSFVFGFAAALRQRITSLRAT